MPYRKYLKPIYAKELYLKLSSGSLILLTITWNLRMILLSFLSRVVSNYQMNISPSNVFPNFLLTKRFHTNSLAVFGCFQFPEF